MSDKVKMNSRLFSNTIMLYILTFSNYLFNFITVPYQTRVLGPIIYGKIGFAVSLMIYFQLFLDFGFLLSATEEVAQHRDDPKRLSHIFTCVSACKLLLILLSSIVLLFLCSSVGRFKEDVSLYVLYFISIAVNSFLPDFLYRGLEEMKAITIRTVLIKLFFTLMIFLCLRQKEQYLIIPILNVIGNSGALLGVYWHLSKKMGITLCGVKIKDILEALKRSSFFFYSRIASTIYSATNTFILGIFYGTESPVVGYYTSADKLITTGKQAISPVTDSLYPYMVKNKDFKLIKKILIIFLPILTIGCIIVAVFAEPICVLLFGKAFRGAGTYLRLLAPVVWCAFPGMLFGFPVLSPVGLANYANISNVIGAAIQIIQLIILFALGIFSAKTVAIITCVTEILTVAFRIGVVVHFRDRYKWD